MESQHRSVLLSEYMCQVLPTDRMPAGEIQPILLGLFGEVGSIMATAKKLHREKAAYSGYLYAVEEEFGDALWYFAALCRRNSLRMDEILSEAATGEKRAPSPKRGPIESPINDSRRGKTVWKKVQ